MGEGAQEAEGSGINSCQHGSSRRRSSNMASGARGQRAAHGSPAARLRLEPRVALDPPRSPALEAGGGGYGAPAPSRHVPFFWAWRRRWGGRQR